MVTLIYKRASAAIPLNMSQQHQSTTISTHEIAHKRKRRVLVLFVLLSVALTGLVISILIPMLVETKISKEVKHSVVIQPDNLPDSLYAKFIRGTIPVVYTIYNITNLYNALVFGEVMRFREHAVRLYKHTYKYNVSFGTPDVVSYKEITTYEVHEDDLYLLAQPIINVNTFYLAAGAQLMRSFLADPSRLGYVTASFPNDGALNEQLLIGGFVGGKILPQIYDTFANPSNAFLTQIRFLALPLYLGYMHEFVVQSKPQYGQDWDTALWFWGRGIPSLSANMTNLFGIDNFHGFELNASLSHPDTSTQTLFDPSNQYSFMHVGGSLQWIGLSKQYLQFGWSIALSNSTTVVNMMTAHTLESIDITIILKWVLSLTVPVSAGATIASSSYEVSVCLALQGQLKMLVAQYPQVAIVLYNNVDDFLPTTWAEIGLLQWSTGLVLGIMMNSDNMRTYGVGVSVTDLPVDMGGGAQAGLGFATGNVEPPEFQAGIQYYAHTNNIHWRSMCNNVDCSPLSPANQWYLWGNDTSLLQPIEVTPAVTLTRAVLSIDTAHHLFTTILASASNYVGLVKSLQVILIAYTQAFQFGVSSTNGNITASVIAATVTANDTYNYLLTQSVTRDLFMSARINLNNWYRIYCYLFNYMGMSLTGTLQQIDDATGVAAQNSGLFTVKSVQDVLFGYIAKYPGAYIPGIAGVRHTSDENAYQHLIDAHFSKAQGRDSVQNTGGTNTNEVGQWLMFEGTRLYQNQCDLIDPSRLYECRGTLNEAANNWEDYNGVEVIAGTSDGLHTSPLREQQSDLVMDLTVYVPQVKRNAPFRYANDVHVKDIRMRHYPLNPALLNVGDEATNPWKNEHHWRQGHVPDGFLSLQSVSGGVPVFVSAPHFGGVSDWAIGCISCGHQPCNTSTYYDPMIHQTYLDIEPLTGLTMQGAKRLQVNFRVLASEYRSLGTTSPDAGFTYHYNRLFTQNNVLYMPYYWAEEYNIVDDADAEQFRSTYHSVVRTRVIARVLSIVGIVGAIIPIVVICVLLIRMYMVRHSPAPVSDLVIV